MEIVLLLKSWMEMSTSDEAMVTVADMEADNGVVHVIDAVLIPDNKYRVGYDCRKSRSHHPGSGYYCSRTG